MPKRLPKLGSRIRIPMVALTRARIAHLDPEAVTRHAVREAYATYAAEARALFDLRLELPGEDSHAALRATSAYRHLLQVVEYGVRDVPPRAELERTLEKLLPLFRRLHSHGVLIAAGPAVATKTFVDLDAFLEALDTFAFDSELGAALVAARARALLARDEALSTTQLAVLAGVGAVTVGNAIRAGTLRATRRERDSTQRRHNPYVIRPTEAKRFLSSWHPPSD